MQPALSEIQEQILQSIREVVCAQTDRAVKNGLTKQQVLDVVKEVHRLAACLHWPHDCRLVADACRLLVLSCCSNERS